MRGEILALCLIVGAFTYAFRVLPTRADLTRLNPDGALSRFLAATGPAAIATLFAAAILPEVQGGWLESLPAVAGVLAVLAAYAATPSVVPATLIGTLAYGAAFWALNLST